MTARWKASPEASTALKLGQYTHSRTAPNNENRSELHWRAGWSIWNVRIGRPEPFFTVKVRQGREPRSGRNFQCTIQLDQPSIPVGGGLEVRGERDVAAPASDGGGCQPEHGPEGVHEDGATDVDGAQDG